MIQGIYLIKNKINDKNYVGSSVNIKGRWASHKSQLRRELHANYHLQCAWKKYGEQSFDFIVHEEVEERSQLIEREQHWIDKLKSADGNVGYNRISDLKKRKGVEQKKGSNSPLSKLNEEKVLKIKELLSTGKFTLQEIANQFGVKVSTINNIRRGTRWTHVKFEKQFKAKERNHPKPWKQKFNEDEVKEIKQMLKDEVKVKKIAEKFEVCLHTIYDIRNGVTYNEIH